MAALLFQRKWRACSQTGPVPSVLLPPRLPAVSEAAPEQKKNGRLHVSFHSCPTFVRSGEGASEGGAGKRTQHSWNQNSVSGGSGFTSRGA